MTFPQSVDVSQKTAPSYPDWLRATQEEAKRRLNTKALFSSERGDHETPDEFFAYYNRIYRFDFDAAAESHNAKLPSFISPEDDALSVDWREWGTVAWLNPPYGRGISKFVRKAFLEKANGVTTVCLLPARTDTAWWHDWVWNGAADIVTFVRGRIKFKGQENGAPFPSAVAVYLGKGA